MKYPGKRILWCTILFVLLLAEQAAAQAPVNYEKAATLLQESVRKHFYKPAEAYYKEHADSAAHNRPASYLWPLCGMIQADNELEVLGVKNRILPTLSIIKKYYDTRSPAPGYASYPPPLGGGDRFYDDNQWIGIAVMDAYARTKQKEYLATGQLIYRFMMTAYDTISGGGLYWQEGKLNGKNTCSNGPGIILALQLYQVTKQKTYLDTALLLYKWVNDHLQDSAGLYYDNIRIPGGRIGRQRYSYNTGTMLQSAVYLYDITHEQRYLDEAKRVAKAAQSYFYGNGRLRDGYWFNAVLLRGYQHLLKHDKDASYINAFKACIDYELQHNLNADGLFIGKDGKAVDLTNQAGMLEILARLAKLERGKTNHPSYMLGYEPE